MIPDQSLAHLIHPLRERILTNSVQPEERIRGRFPFFELVASSEPCARRRLPLFAGCIVVGGWIW